MGDVLHVSALPCVTAWLQHHIRVPKCRACQQVQ